MMFAKKSALAGRRAQGLTCVCLIASLFSPWAQAQSALSFAEALQKARLHHPSVQARQAEQAAALAEKAGAEWARYPTPTLEASSKGAVGANTGVLRIDQPLWAGGRITAGIAAAESRHQAATVGIEESRLDIGLRVIAAYAEALRQTERMAYAQTNVREHEKLLEMIDRRVDKEVSSQADRRLAESRLLQAQTDLSLVQQARSQSLVQLSQLTGGSVGRVDWAGVVPGPLPAQMETVMEAALAHSPTLLRVQHSEEAANADIDSKRSAYWPQLALRLEKTTGGFNPDERAMVVLTAQPGAGLSAGAGVDAAVARREALRHERMAVQRDVRERVEFDWTEWQAAQTRLEATRRTSEITSEVFDSYARQYVTGRKTWIDVLNAVRENVQARFAFADAKTQSTAAALRLQARMGRLEQMP